MAGAAIHADDTPVNVLAPGTGKTKTGRLWVYLRDERDWSGSTTPAAFYRFAPGARAAGLKIISKTSRVGCTLTAMPVLSSSIAREASKRSPAWRISDASSLIFTLHKAPASPKKPWSSAHHAKVNLPHGLYQFMGRRGIRRVQSADLDEQREHPVNHLSGLAQNRVLQAASAKQRAAIQESCSQCR